MCLVRTSTFVKEPRTSLLSGQSPLLRIPFQFSASVPDLCLVETSTWLPEKLIEDIQHYNRDVARVFSAPKKCWLCAPPLSSPSLPDETKFINQYGTPLEILSVPSYATVLLIHSLIYVPLILDQEWENRSVFY